MNEKYFCKCGKFFRKSSNLILHKEKCNFLRCSCGDYHIDIKEIQKYKEYIRCLS